MFRMWGKLWKDNHLLRDTVIEDDSKVNRTKKVLAALDEIAYQFDLSRPVWLDKTVKEFQQFSRARFYQDNFIEEIEFDYLEIQMLDEDDRF